MKDENRTIFACFIGYVVQAIVNNFIPLLFLTFRDAYSLPLGQITFLVTFNFGVQLLVDFLSAAFVDKIGYKPSIVFAHAASALGLVLLAVLPDLMPPFAGLLIAVCVYAIGGGLIEVLVSPIMESCPTKNKEKAMSLLHSFYCWGHVGVVALSTLFFGVVGIAHWRILALLWAIVPAANLVLFLRSPVAPLLREGEKGMTARELGKSKLFWIFFLMMFCAGASEQAVSQWASAFAEQGLGVSKTIGDLAGPLSFALLMGTSRAVYGKWGDKIKLDLFITASLVLCVASYLLISLVPNPVVGLIGCGLCGFSVGILWPGTFSRASASLKRGGTRMFAFLALAGDVGCSAGPTLTGTLSSLFGDNLHLGILCGVCFPLLFLACMFCLKKSKNS